MLVVTDSWTKIMHSITKFILKRRASDNNFIGFCEVLDIYNMWVTQTGTIIPDTELALWCVDYITNLIAMPFERLKRAAMIDKII